VKDHSTAAQSHAIIKANPWLFRPKPGTQPIENSDLPSGALEEAMKKALLAFLLITPALASADKPKPNPADYTIAIHVQLSRQVAACTGNTCQPEQQLTVTIDGKKYELQSGFARDLLRTGDYKAKIAKDETRHAYEYTRIYEFLFPDGVTRQSSVMSESE
jgi:hypothetical protein